MTLPARQVTSLEIPSPPQVLAAIIREAGKDEGGGMGRLTELCASDPNVAVEILRLVNSPAYYRGARVVSVQRAICLLGTRSLRNLAICTAARACSVASKVGELDLRRFWEDSLRRAVAGQLLAQSCEGEGAWDPSEAFTVGLLQDLGVIALLQTYPDRAEAWMAHVDAPPDVRRREEEALFGIAHDAVAESLAQAWELPPDLAVPLIYHHRPEQAPEAWRHRCCVMFHAELLSAVLADGDRRAALDRARQVLALDRGFTTERVDELVDALGRQVEDTARALGMEVGAQPTLEQVLQSANRSLIALNLSYEDLVKRLEKTLAEKDALSQELERRNRELEQLSLGDELTGLPNRRAFSGRLSYEIARTARSGGALVMIFGDVDKFKSVNDTWGHDFGDQVLKSVATCMAAAVRQTDMVARVGGEEFVVLLPATELDGGRVVAQKILQSLRERVLKTPTGQARAFTISLGMVWVQGPAERGANLEAMAARIYKVADKALYASKEGGRDRVTEVPQPLPWP